MKIKRCFWLLCFAFFLSACNSPDPLGFVARAERDTQVARFETAAEVEIARINAERAEENLLAGLVIAFLLVLVGTVLGVAVIRADVRVRIAQAQIEAQRRIPPPALPTYTQSDPSDWEAVDGEWRETHTQIARRSTALTNRRDMRL